MYFGLDFLWNFLLRLSDLFDLRWTNDFVRFIRSVRFRFHRSIVFSIFDIFAGHSKFNLRSGDAEEKLGFVIIFFCGCYVFEDHAGSDGADESPHQIMKQLSCILITIDRKFGRRGSKIPMLMVCKL